MQLKLVVIFLSLFLIPAGSSWADETGQVEIKATDVHVDFLVGGDLVGRYHISPELSEVAKPYFWPLNGPNGLPITRGWPMEAKIKGGSDDHVHQKSAWFCHGDIVPEGLTLKHKIKNVEGVDFWSEGKGHGRIVGKVTHVDFKRGGITTQNEWRTADGQRILDETRIIRLLSFGTTRLFVVEIDLHASVVPLTFGDTKEGSFGIRIHDALREVKGSGILENADGKTREANCWGRKSAWCDYSGTLEGSKVGLAILSDPANPSPSCWHSRGYGLMAANPFGREKSGFPDMAGNTKLVRLEKGEHLRLRYGILIHPGDAKEGRVAEYFDRFVKSRQ